MCLCGIFEPGAISFEAREGVHQQKSGSSVPGSLIQLVSESDKLCLLKGKTLIVHLGQTHSFGLDDDIYFGSKTFEHFA